MKNRNKLLKLEIRVKMWYSRLKGFIHPVKEELKFMWKAMFILNTISKESINNLQYQKDVLSKRLQFDWQFDCIEVMKRGGGDCNSIHRMWQVYYHLLDFEAFLVTYIAQPFKSSHTTCMHKDGAGYWIQDYSYVYVAYSMEDALSIVAQRHKSKVRNYVVQDINWKIIN